MSERWYLIKCQFCHTLGESVATAQFCPPMVPGSTRNLAGIQHFCGKLHQFMGRNPPDTEGRLTAW